MPDDRFKEQAPRYSDGDEWRPASASSASIAQIQRAMVTAGILTDFNYGIWDQKTAKAYRDVLSYANGRGVTDQQALSELASHPQLNVAGGSGGGGSRVVGFDPDTGQPIFAPAEPLQVRTTPRDDLRRVFRSAVVDRLGEGWSTAQIDELVNAYQWNEIKVQSDAYNQQAAAASGMLGSNPVIATQQMASPEAFADEELRRRDPVGYQAGGVVNDALPAFMAALKGY